MKFINANIHTMRNQVIENGYLVVKEGKIASFGPMDENPSDEGETLYDLEGKMLLPGFIDAHTHIGMWEDGVGPEGMDLNEMTDPVTPHIRALDAIDPLDISFEDARLAGVTTVCVSPGSANPVAGQIVALKTRPTNWLDKMILAEPFAMKFALGENPKRVYGEGREEAPHSRMATAAIIRETLAKAQRYLDELEKEEEDKPDLDFKLEALIPVLR